MSIYAILGDIVTFYALVFGLGALWWRQLRGDQIERITLMAVLGITQIFLGAWLIYLTKAPAISFYLLPALAVAGFVAHAKPLRLFLATPDVARVFGHLLLLSGWCIGWLALVRCYGGGEWSGDWIEHHQRARFFLDHGPLEARFLEVYSVTSRPPLANLVIGALLALRGLEFAHTQVFTALFSSLLLLPALLLVRRLAGHNRRDALLLVLLMFNPMVVQNATFAWTKLPCTFFVLTFLAFYSRGVHDPTPWRRTVAIAALALGVLTHYSAAPYVVALVPLHAWWLAKHRRTGLVRELVTQACVAAIVLSPWLVWALWSYGLAGTMLDNPTVTAEAGYDFWTRVGFKFHSAWVTLVPHVLRSADYRYIAQFSQLGYLRDYWFNIYQTTLPGACGWSGLVLLATVIARRTAAVRVTRFWLLFVVIVSVLNVVSIPGDDRWGTAHIGFSTLIIGLLAWLAAGASLAPRSVRLLWACALMLDAAFGIVLQFYVQNVGFPSPADVRRFLAGETFTYAHAVARNAICKLVEHAQFVSDGGPPAFLVALLLLVLGGLAIRAAWTAITTTSDAPPRVPAA